MKHEPVLLPALKKSPKVNRTIRFSRALLDEAAQLGIDVNEFCRQNLEAYVVKVRQAHRYLKPKRGKRP